MEPTEKITLGGLVNRVTSPTPGFWLKLRFLWGWIAGLAGTLLMIDHEVAGLIPHAVITIAKIVGLPAVTTWAHTFLAKNTPDNDSGDKSQVAQ